MQLTGPPYVQDDEAITITASGFGKAYSVKFDVVGRSGNVGFDIKETRGAPTVTFRTTLAFAGSERIDAIAQDELGNVIDKASFEFTVTLKVKPKGGAMRRAKDTGQRRRHDDIENKGMRRSNDSGQRRRHDDAEADGPGAGGGYGPGAEDGPGNGGGYGPEDGPGNGGGYIIEVEASTKTEVNGEWRYRMRGIKDMHSVLIELYGSNGGLFRLFPRGRDVMDHAITPLATGKTLVFVTGRNALMENLVTVMGVVNVVQKGAATGHGPGAGGGYVTNFAPIEPMGVAKPPFALSNDIPTDDGPIAVGHSTSSGASSLDALIEAKKAELLARLGKK